MINSAVLDSPGQRARKEQNAVVQSFRDEVYEGLPFRFRRHLAANYRAACRKGGVAKADNMLRDVSAIVGNASGRIIGNDSAVCDWARSKAQECQLIGKTFADEVRAYSVMSDLAVACSVIPPDSRGMTLLGAMSRMCSSKWWRRQARKRNGRALEEVAILLNIVHRKQDLFVSDESVARRTEQKRRNRILLESGTAVNEFGDTYTMAELSDLSVSNPVHRRDELMLRTAGFEKKAIAAGYVGEFYTWTCPSRMHSTHYKTGIKNRNYDHTTPMQAQRFLCLQWSRARSELARLGIDIYGFRVCEPHHDGTPHWHMLFFMAPEHSDTVRKVLLHYALGEGDDRTEDGAEECRFEAKRLDPAIGPAAGYLAKYIAKNIDGFGLKEGDDALFDRTPETFAARVDAWASTWGIKQFQQIGGESVMLYRELRRFPKKVPVSDPVIELVRKPADDGDWCGYLSAMAAVNVGLHRVWSDDPGIYGDPLGWKIIGVESPFCRLTSRRYEWTVSFEKKSVKSFSGLKLLSDVSASFSSFFLPFGEAARAWSPVNNCTSTKFDHDKKIPERLDDVDSGSALHDQFDRRNDRNSCEGVPIEVYRPPRRPQEIH